MSPHTPRDIIRPAMAAGTVVPTVVVAVAVAVSAALAMCLLRLRRQRDLAAWQATHDPLTGAPNRRAFTTTLVRLLAAGQPVAVAMIDLDRFKHLNDRHGHLAGDQVLAEIAGRLMRLPPPVTMAARLGGDEFALLVTGGLAQALAAARGAWAAVTGPPVTIAGGHRVQPGASVGVAACHRGITAAQLLHHADLALQHAKTSGGGVRAHTREQPDQPVTSRPAHRRRDQPHQ